MTKNKPDNTSKQSCAASSSSADTDKHLGVKKAMNLLLADQATSLDDKIATVKTVCLVDKRRVETALKTLMKK